jgi:hypothetical protein
VDGEPPDDDLVNELAASADAQAEAVRLVGVFAQLPGDGARAAESRLDQLLDAVSLVATGHVVTAHAAVPAK